MQPSDSVRKMKNPLLAAGSDFPFENFSENTLLMPVTPTTPAILQSEPEPTVPSDRFRQPPLPNTPLQYPPVAVSRQESSLPQHQNLITPPTNAPLGTSAPPPAAPPRAAGPGLYRLGNQRRLKYALPPDITPSSTKPQQIFQPPVVPSFPDNQPTSFYNPNAHISQAQETQQPDPQFAPPVQQVVTPPFNSQQRASPKVTVKDNTSRPIPSENQYQQPAISPFPVQANVVAPPPTFYNPGSQTITQPSPVQSYAPTAPPLSGTSSQGSSRGSLQNSFRNSPTFSATSGATPPTSNARPGLLQSNPITFSPPQGIPSRVIEPSTPQNTPADSFGSGFAAYRSSRQDFPISHAGTPRDNFNTGNELQAIRETVPQPAAPGLENTFTPISAATVTEKLEHLIAQQKDDDASSEVATITSKIVDANIIENVELKNASDELSEIDLNATRDESLLENRADPQFGELNDQLDLQNAPQITLPATDYFLNPLENKCGVEGNSQQSNFFSSQDYNNTTPKYLNYQDPFAFVKANAENFTTTSALPSTPHSQEIFNKSQPLPPTVSTSFSGYNEQGISGVDQGDAKFVNTYANSPLQQAPTFFDPSQFIHSKNPDNTGSIEFGINPVKQIAFPADNFNVIAEPTGSATLNPVQASLNQMANQSSDHKIPPSLENLASGNMNQQLYRPVYHHWFHRKEVESKVLWLPFSMHDSLNLEDVHNSIDISPETIIATDGGRYDVSILKRQRYPIYWEGAATEVRRCSWFYKGPTESRYNPYDEKLAVELEEEYKQCCTTNVWNKRIDLNNGEYIVFHTQTSHRHYPEATTPEPSASWGNNNDSGENGYFQGITRSKAVKRGLDEFNIEDGEPERIDHILFLVHGIGSVCDLKFRSVEEVVDDFRSISLQLVQSHYKTSCEQEIVNRIEVLPISWHAALHSGIDEKLQAITLESIPKLRNFTNDTVLDVLFYTSPMYCETIVQTVGNELNRLYTLFKHRNPDFSGNTYLGGHSLGSLILFDILCHQTPDSPDEPMDAKDDQTETKPTTTGILKSSNKSVLKRTLSKKINYVLGTAGTGQPYINYPQLIFHPRAFFALGSPIGMFVTVRGIDTLGEDFILPTCPAFFNIFHPFDPVAYRIESLINQEAAKHRPMLIPHHKGRKRMHLELKETMARVGADLKQKLLDSVKSTWNAVYLTMFQKQDNQNIEEEIHKVVEEQLNKAPTELNHLIDGEAGIDLKIGKLNEGRRIDYVLQEAPFEYINEYIFALTSHVCYWESEDTMLMILKEIYGSMGIQTDAQLPQQTMQIERTRSSYSSIASPTDPTSPTSFSGMDPTSPMSSQIVGPPPTSGFVRKT